MDLGVLATNALMPRSYQKVVQDCHSEKIGARTTPEARRNLDHPINHFRSIVSQQVVALQGVTHRRGHVLLSMGPIPSQALHELLSLQGLLNVF